MRYAITNTGYLPNSPDRNNDFNIIPSNNITMKGVPHPILGVDNQGNIKLMSPGKDYKFKGDKVLEIPIRQNGGEQIKIPFIQPEYTRRFSNYKPDPNNRIIRQRDDFQRDNFLSYIAGGGSRRKDHTKYGTLGDLYRHYSGEPLKHNVLERSQYKPLNSKDPNINYVSINDENFKKQVLDNWERVSTKGINNAKGQNAEHKLNDSTFNVSGYRSIAEGMALGHYTVSKGKDEKGEYVSYYDKFDATPGKGTNLWEKIGLVKPFEIYGRIYIDPKTGKEIPLKQIGGEQISTSDPRYAELYRNRQVGSWSPQHQAFNLPDLPEVTVTAKDERINEGIRQGRQKFALGVLNHLGAPQEVLMDVITGKQQTPSQAWGFDTTDKPWYHPKSISNFAMDSVLDPVNLIGVGIADDLTRGFIRKGLKRNTLEVIPDDVAKALPKLEQIPLDFKIEDVLKNISVTDRKNMEIIKKGNAYFKELDNPESLKRLKEFGDEYGIDLLDAYKKAEQRWDYGTNIGKHDRFQIAGKEVFKDDIESALGVSTVKDEYFKMKMLKPKSKTLIPEPKTEIDKYSINYVNEKASIKDYDTIIWHELSHDINKNIINQSTKLQRDLSDIFVKNIDEVDKTKIESAFKSQKFDTYEKGLVKSKKEKMSLEDIAKDELSYVSKPTETWAFLSTNLRQDLKNTGIMKNYNELLTPEKLEQAIKNGNTVFSRFEPYIKDKEAFIKLFNKMTLSIAPAALYLQSQNQNKQNEEQMKKKYQDGGEMNECYKCGGEMKKYQNAGEYFGELSPGMMFDPFQYQDMFGFGFKEEFKPAPVKMLDMLFDQNQQQIDQARYPQVERMMTDPSQMVRPLAKDDPFLYKGRYLLNRPTPQADIKLPGKIPGVSNNRPQRVVDPGWGMRRAMLATMGLGIARDLTDKRESLYDYEMRQQGNSLSKINPSNSFSDYGDYTLNAGLGSNFRPIAKNGGQKYQDGGEYDLSQEEIEELIRQGYDVEFL